MNVKQIRAIEQHCKVLQSIFPKTRKMDPLELYNKLHRLEATAARIGLRGCNGPEWKPGEKQKAEDRVLTQVNRLLDFRALNVPVFVNDDPRGYALLVEEQWTWGENTRRIGPKKPNIRPLRTDMGGCGILCPNFT